MTCEVKVKVKNDDKQITKKTYVFQTITASFDEPKIMELVDEACHNFGGDHTKVEVTIKLIEE